MVRTWLGRVGMWRGDDTVTHAVGTLPAIDVIRAVLRVVSVQQRWRPVRKGARLQQSQTEESLFTTEPN